MALWPRKIRCVAFIGAKDSPVHFTIGQVYDGEWDTTRGEWLVDGLYYAASRFESEICAGYFCGCSTCIATQTRYIKEYE